MLQLNIEMAEVVIIQNKYPLKCSPVELPTAASQLSQWVMLHLSCNAGPAFYLLLWPFCIEGQMCQLGLGSRRPLFQQRRPVAYLTCEL